MEIKITKINIITNPYAADVVLVRTGLPPTMPKVSNTLCGFRFFCEKDTGKQYCEENFPGIPIEVIPG